MEVQKIPKRTVTLIEPKKSILVDKEKYHQKRVAAYCRVSTDSEEQLTSYQNQMRVYTEMIAARKSGSLPAFMPMRASPAQGRTNARNFSA